MTALPTIRGATAADGPEVARLCAQWGYPTTADAVAGRLRGLLESASHVVLVAESGGALAGWCTGEIRLTLSADRRAEVTGLVVDALARRKGIGRLLVAGVEGWAGRQGCREIYLRTNVARTESHPFYESLGFRRTKTQHAYSKQLATVP